MESITLPQLHVLTMFWYSIS